MIDAKNLKHPSQNLSEELKSMLESGNPRFDVHCHLFTRDYIPDNYFHLRLPWLMKRRMLRRLIRILKGRKKEDDTWTQHATDLMEVAGKNSLAEVAAEMLQQSEADFLYCPLMMDMTQAFGKSTVTTHCGGNTTRVLANAFELPFRRYDSQGCNVDDLLSVSFKNDTEKGLFFSDPVRWLPVLERFPKLRLNLAHFGGEEEWKRFSRNNPNTWVHRIVSMMEDYEHVYTDVSFLLHLTEKRNSGFLETFEELLKEKELVRNRTLFGSDYYMVLIHEKLPSVTQNFLFRLDDTLENKLTRENPRRFLGL